MSDPNIREAEPDDGSEAPAKRFKFPTALTVLAIVLLVVWLASFFIPAGVYEIDPETGGPIPGSYHELPNCDNAVEGELCSNRSLSHQFGLLWRATPNGLYGVESVTTRQVSADEEGFLYGSAQIFLFVLAVGAFITMTMKTGAIETGIKRLALRFRHSPALLVAVLMSVFALGGTTYGMWEETLGFFVLLVPLTLALGYDRMVAVAIIFLGAGTGVLASTVNPFATGVASDAAGISISDGLGVRLAHVRRARARRDRLRALVREPGPQGRHHGRCSRAEPARQPRPRTSTRSPSSRVRRSGSSSSSASPSPRSSTASSRGTTSGTTIFDAEFPLWTFSNFYFTEASMLFIVAAVVVGLIARFGEERIVNTIVAGAADFLGAALVIVAARGITVVMKNTYITDTVLNWMEEAVSDSSNVAFAVLGVHHQHPDRVPGPVVVGTRRARDADPRATVGLRRRRALDVGDRVPVGIGLRELPDADRRRGDGRPHARQGGLQPVPALPRSRSSAIMFVLNCVFVSIAAVLD